MNAVLLKSANLTLNVYITTNFSVESVLAVTNYGNINNFLKNRAPIFILVSLNSNNCLHQRGF